MSHSGLLLKGEVIMIELHFDSDTLHTFPPVFTGSDMSKFGLFLDCEALQF